jgi:hypothetical protein
MVEEVKRFFLSNNLYFEIVEGGSYLSLYSTNEEEPILVLDEMESAKFSNWVRAGTLFMQRNPEAKVEITDE